MRDALKERLEGLTPAAQVQLSSPAQNPFAHAGSSVPSTPNHSIAIVENVPSLAGQDTLTSFLRTPNIFFDSSAEIDADVEDRTSRKRDRFGGTC